MPKVKICGITSYEDASAAIDCGADLLGFNFYEKSPRYIDPVKAMEIARKLPTFIDTVAVFVNAEESLIHELTEDGYFNWVQLHGDESPEFCDSINWNNLRTIKAIRVRGESDIGKISSYGTDAILLDSYDSKSYGGTGKPFDWDLADVFNRRVYIAGGINPENVGRALELLPYGIDICSGVESEPGKKDKFKMEKLFEAISSVKS